MTVFTVPRSIAMSQAVEEKKRGIFMGKRRSAKIVKQWLPVPSPGGDQKGAAPVRPFPASGRG
jgi:hypothetical protein